MKNKSCIFNGYFYFITLQSVYVLVLSVLIIFLLRMSAVRLLPLDVGRSPSKSFRFLVVILKEHIVVFTQVIVIFLESFILSLRLQIVVVLIFADRESRAVPARVVPSLVGFLSVHRRVKSRPQVLSHHRSNFLQTISFSQQLVYQWHQSKSHPQALSHHRSHYALDKVSCRNIQFISKSSF